MKHSNPEHPDYYCIKEAVVKIQSVAIKINEKKKYQEESQKLLQIQNSIDGNFLVLHLSSIYSNLNFKNKRYWLKLIENLLEKEI